MTAIAFLLGTVAGSISKAPAFPFAPTYFEVAIPQTGVGSDLVDFPVWVPLSRMPTSFWGLVRSDGGNLRAFTSIGGAEIPLDVVSVMPFAQNGSVYVKVPTVYTAQATSFYIACMSLDTLRRPRTDPLGMNGVWADYESVFLGGEIAPLADRAHPTRQFTQRGNIGLFEYKLAGSPSGGTFEASFAVADQSRQGTAHDAATGETVLIDNNTLRRYSSTWTLLGTNANPIGDVNTALGISTLTQCGDGCIVGDLLVVPMTNFGTNTVSAIACFNKTTLALVGATNISATDALISGLCWNADIGRLVSCSWGAMTAFRRYALNTSTGTVTADGSITLSLTDGSFNNEADGIEYWKGSYWVASSVTAGVIRIGADGVGSKTEEPVSYSDTSGAFSAVYAGISQYRDGFLVTLRTISGDPNTFVFYQPVQRVARGGAGAKFPNFDSGTSAARLQVTGLPSSTVFTMGASVRHVEAAQQVVMSYRNLASGATDDRATLVVRQEGIRRRHYMWDDINLWMDAHTVDADGTLNYRLTGIYNGTARNLYVDGAFRTGSALAITPRGDDFDTLTIGVADEDGESYSGFMSFAYLRLDAVSLDWVEAEALMTNEATPFCYVKQVPTTPYATLGMPDAYIVATKTAVQSVGNTLDPVTFNNVIASSGWAFTSGSDFTVPAGINLLEINYISNFTAFVSTGDVQAVIERNGAEVLARITDDQSWGPMNLRTVLPVVAGDVIRFRLQSFTGTTNLATQTRATIKGWST